MFNLLKIIFSSEKNPHKFINLMFSRLFKNPQDSIEYTDFINNKNLNKKLKEFQMKLDNEHYSFIDFRE
jgi:disulfide oxidoreductase YuzD